MRTLQAHHAFSLRSDHPSVPHFTWQGISSTIFAIFDCVEFDDQTRLLTRDYSIDCNGPRHELWRIYACVMIVVYPVRRPLPCTVLSFLSCN